MRNRKFQTKIIHMPAGQYWIGDPCYAYKDLTPEQMEHHEIDMEDPADTWVDQWCNLREDDEQQSIAGIPVAMYGTAYGDGSYSVDWIQGDPFFNHPKKGQYIPSSETYQSHLGVDSGTIGLVPIALGVTPAEMISTYERLVSLYLDMVDDFVFTVGPDPGYFTLCGQERNLGRIEIAINTGDSDEECDHCGHSLECCDCDYDCEEE